MIRVDIYLVPHGNETKARQIGKILIANDGKSWYKGIGHYTYKIFQKGRNAVWKSGNIVDFPRLKLGVYDLLFRVLRDALQERNMK